VKAKPPSAGSWRRIAGRRSHISDHRLSAIIYMDMRIDELLTAAAFGRSLERCGMAGDQQRK
jgi:hypothetical protein